MNKKKISARKFINLIKKNNSGEVAFYYKTQSQTQIMETIMNDELKHFLIKNAEDKTYHDFSVCPANQDISADEMNENLVHPFDLFYSGVVVSFWDGTDSAQTYTKILLYYITNNIN
jgi:hypothetical protein